MTVQSTHATALRDERTPAYPLTELPIDVLIDTRHDVLRLPAVPIAGGVALPGLRTGVKRGQGIEFIDLRLYNEGDDVRHIDWNVTARSNQPYTRLYREEKENTTTAVVDFRHHMYTGSSMLRAVRAGHQAARLLWNASAAGDRVAAIVVKDGSLQETRPATGRRGVLSACELIAAGFADAESPAAAATDSLEELYYRLIRTARHSGSYVVFSGFDYAGNTWSAGLNALAAQRRTTGVLVIDHLEQQALPRGRYRIQHSSGQHATVTVDGTNHSALQQHLYESMRQTQESFDKTGVPLLLDPVDAPWQQTLIPLLRASLHYSQGDS